LEEPSVLPASFPQLLVNGSSGIAVGMATNIPPHNLGEVIDSAIHVINNPDCAIEDLISLMPGPDFPTKESYKEEREYGLLIRQAEVLSESEVVPRLRAWKKEIVNALSLTNCHTRLTRPEWLRRLLSW
jgi:hypothetical protein